MNADDVRAIALPLPGADQVTSGGTTTFRVRGRLFARLREGGATLVLERGPFERPHLMEDCPDVFSSQFALQSTPIAVVQPRAASYRPRSGG